MYHLHLGAGGLFGLGMLAGLWITQDPAKAPSSAAMASTANAVAMLTGSPASGSPFITNAMETSAASTGEIPPSALMTDMAGHAARLAQNLRLEQKLKMIADQCTLSYTQMPAMVTSATRMPAALKDPDLLATLQDAGLTGCAVLHLPVNQLIDPALLSSFPATQ